MKTNEITIPVAPGINLKGILNDPVDAEAIVIFSHGSGSGRLSSRNNYVADALNKKTIATLLTDLLTEKEYEIYENRFNIDLLTKRLVAVTNFVKHMPGLGHLKIGYFGASTGAASALKAAAIENDGIQAVVSRGGRPDLAKESLAGVNVPTLLIVGSHDAHVLELNQFAYDKLTCEKKMQIIEGAGHLFEEAGKLDEVANLATAWFEKHLHSEYYQLT